MQIEVPPAVSQALAQLKQFFSSRLNAISVGALAIGAGSLVLGTLFLFQTKNQDESVAFQPIISDISDHQVASPSAQPRKHVVVAVTGAVKSPGSYALEEQSRVGEAIASAGGVLRQANRAWIDRYVNMAQKLRDEMLIFIPFEGEDGIEADGGSVSSDKQLNTQVGLVNVNTATLTQLTELKGIGEVRAQGIVSGRPYATFSEFLERSGLSSSLTESVKSSITF